MAVTLTRTDMWDDTKRLHVIGTIALTGNYTTGGIAVDFRNIITDKPGQVGLPGISTQPTFVRVQGIAGYVYEYDKVNKKLIIRQASPAGTVSKPTFTVTKGAILASSELGLSADAATGTVNNNTIASTLTLTTNSPVSAPTFTGTASPLAELSAAALPAGVTGDTIEFEVIFKKAA